MRRFLTAMALVLVSILFTQCQKELSHIGRPDPLILPPDPVTATIQGNILDENGQPAAAVTVKVGTKTAITDAKGYFRIKDASLDKSLSLVTAEKAGYFKSLRSFPATTGVNQVVLKLIKKDLAGTVDAATGGDVTLSNGTKVTLPANGVVKAAGGGAHSGSINVYVAYIDPTAADIGQAVPGSFMADDKNGSRVTLASYGMVAVELESSTGEKLQIRSGSKATLTTAIPSSLQGSAPASIAMWHVDEQKGIWKEEGSATKQGNNYVAEVSHFSFWNCDVSINSVLISMTIRNAAGQPVAYGGVRIKRNSIVNSQAYGYTDLLGQVSGLVPANEQLTLEVLGPCGNVVHTQAIGPFAQVTNLGVITLPATTSSVVTVTGTVVNCSGGPVSNGYAMVAMNNFVYYAETNATGNFTLSVLVCSGSTTAQVLGVDESTMVQGNATSVTVTGSSVNTGTIQACGTSASQYVNYSLDGTTYSIAPPAADSLMAYTYQAQGTTNYTTLVQAAHFTSNKSIYFSFNHTAPAAGTYPVVNMSTQGFVQNNTIIAPFNVVVTNFPQAIGQYYEGSFSGRFKDNQNVTHTLSGTFRIRKNF